MRARRWSIGLVAALAPFAQAGCAQAAVRQPEARPRLVVTVVVDQLAEHVVERWGDVFTGGLRRLLDGGYRFTQAVHAHALTETAAGHATLSTGVYPSRHGVIANEWFEQREGRWRLVYSVSDTASRIVGEARAPGRSPANLARPGFADWLRAADGEAKVASISRKDRAAITMAGRVAGDVYWIQPEVGRFVTSVYYRAALPDWVERFNRDMPMAYADTVWWSRVPAQLALRARPDSSVYEGDGVHTAFPHRVGELVADTGVLGRNLWLVEVPFPDAATAAFAMRALAELDLGRDEHTDFLSISFSQTDAVGHNYGPTSLEQLDNLLRLDRLLGELMAEFDARVGAGRWLLALSADHGVMLEPEARNAAGQPGRRLSLDELRAMVDAANGAAGRGGLEEVRRRAAAHLETNDVIADILLEDELRSTTAPADSFVALYRNSYFEGRYPGRLGRSGMWPRYVEGTIVDYATGSTHGSPYLYDRRVPLIFYGAGVRAGVSSVAARTVDLAPTLARWLGIPFPEVDGRVLDVPRN